LKIKKKEEITMSNVGKVYFYNMANRQVTVVLNGGKPFTIKEVGPKPGYEFSRYPVERSADPEPWHRCIFGLKNNIVFTLQGGDPNTVEIEIDLEQHGYHLDADLLLFIYYRSVVLRVEDSAAYYPAQHGDGVESQGPLPA
jgi:hypothetical protein